MAKLCWRLACVALAVQASWAGAQGLVTPVHHAERARALAHLPDLNLPDRPDVRRVLEHPTLVGQGPKERFVCRPEHYFWFLDHPDRAVVAWRRLGAKCVTIQPRSDGLFSWNDGQGSEVIWEIVQRGPHQHVWFADGKVKPGPVLPAVPVKAVVVLRYQQVPGMDGTPLVEHQAVLYASTDSKTAAMLTRILGPTAPKMAEQGLGNMQLFFAGLSWYLHRNPDQAPRLMQAGQD